MIYMIQKPRQIDPWTTAVVALVEPLLGPMLQLGEAPLWGQWDVALVFMYVRIYKYIATE